MESGHRILVVFEKNKRSFSLERELHKLILISADSIILHYEPPPSYKQIIRYHHKLVNKGPESKQHNKKQNIPERKPYYIKN